MIRPLCFLLMLLGLPAAGQVPTIKTELIAVALAKPISGLFMKSGESILPFSANLGNLGQPIVYSGPARLILHDREENFQRPSSNEPLPVPVAIVDLPPTATRVMLVCLQRPDKPLEIRAYDISGSNLRGGDYRFFNYASIPIAVKLGTQRFSVAPGRDHIATSPAWRQDVLDLEIQLATLTNGKPRLAYSSGWGHRPGMRNLIFLFDGHHPSNPVLMSRFHDYAPVEPAEP